jgi:hypothetical protein
MDEGLLERLEAVLDDLANLDVDTLDDTTVDDLVVALGSQSTRLEAAWCRLIGVWDHRQLWATNGSKSPAARLARETHRRPADTARLVRRARHLDHMPHTAAAHAAAEICGAHVDLVASCQRPWRNADFAASEDLLIDLCRTRWFDNAVAAIEQWKLLADRDATRRGVDPVTDGRHLSVAVGWGGEVVVNGALDPVGGEILATALQRICDQLRIHDQRHGVTRTTRQRRADALVEMATRAATAPADGLRPRPLFTVTIGIEHFNWMCHTAAGTLIAPDLLIPQLSDADIERIVYDPANRNITASRRRRFGGALRHIIEIRDQHCQHPTGCNEPAPRCDIDPITPHPDGITCLCNGQLLCTHHNRVVKAATDAATRTQCAVPPHRNGDPSPCPIDHTPTWTATTHHADPTDTARAPPTAG